MIRFIRNRIFGLSHNYTSSLERQRASSLLLITYAGLVAHLGVYVITVLAPLIRGERDATVLELVALIVPPFLLIAVYFLIQTGRLRNATYLFIAGLCLATIPIAIQPGIDFSFVILGAVLVGAGVLLGRGGLTVVLAVLFASFLVRWGLQNELTSAVRVVPADYFSNNLIVLFAAFGAPALFMYVFSGSVERIAASSVEDIRQFRLIGSFISKSEHLGEEAILETTLHFLEKDLGYSLAQIYLIDSDGSISRRLRSSSKTSEVFQAITQTELEVLTLARALKPQPDDLPEQGVMVIRATNSLEEARYLVPPARSAALIPVSLDGRIFALIDVQSASDNTFTQERLGALKVLAEGIASSLERAGAFTELERTVQEQELLLRRVRSQLSAVQSRGEQMMTTGWNRYLDTRGTAIGFDLIKPGDGLSALEPIPAADLPATIREVLQRGEVHVESLPDEQLIKVPILLRGEVLGAMSFSVPNDRPVTDRQLEMVRTVATRLAAALENNRLFEQSQAQAQRERKANEVASQLLTATDVEALMSLAAQSFNEALGAIYTRVSLEPGILGEPPVTPTNGSGAHDDPGNGNGNGKHEG